MFTGIITGLGRIEASEALGTSPEHGRRLTLQAPDHYLDDVAPGDSIALNGACMTVTTLDRNAQKFTVDVSAESLRRTCGLNQIGPVNLEKALRADERFGGHIVSGHVDGLGTVARMEQVGESWTLDVLAPRTLAPYLAYKGSVAVQGVSLTLNEVQDTAEACRFSINLIPHTVAHTTLGLLRAGDPVNLEIDTVARYVRRMLDSIQPPREAA